jgi:hypothetical protein
MTFQHRPMITYHIPSLKHAGSIDQGAKDKSNKNNCPKTITQRYPDEFHTFLVILFELLYCRRLNSIAASLKMNSREGPLLMSVLLCDFACSVRTSHFSRSIPRVMDSIGIFVEFQKSATSQSSSNCRPDPNTSANGTAR